MGRERNDVAVKDILSQLSKDETVLEEVRKIFIRGLTAQGRSSGDNQRARSPSQKVERGNNSDTSEQKNSGEKILVRPPLQEDTKQQATVTESDEDLAFTIRKDSDTYRNIFSTVQWYRDSFLIGSAFADERSAERQGNRRQDEKIQTKGENVQTIGNQSVNQSVIPKSDPSTAMGHPLLLSAAESYIRSIAAVDLLRPYATWAVSMNGPMFQNATQSMAQSIPLAQSSCDWAMRENLLWVLKDEEWMEFAKSITTKYVDRSYKDG
mmetsp:Transcript_21556/g.46886  ORF Transcript_21556/g.46886 Transcript_21556/m.46886 type:complete len:266 (-) Transcript_21556:349-1146(-)|eukprot:CAMPEP_0172316218 /NCGR_PEP_ID=MMETSP1058-20130122/27522_1 /TAXON_ID=83371 /ORGANISM="Detonula confervacea, Strain CCMP 353" /LENGTH=265 /DNA_ID=CAMNT_0013030479 /DNA_START=208 /DNA_END=1005 /DNA_ORIENTATION=-